MSEQQQAHPTTTESELIAVRRDKLAKIRELGIDPYGARFDVTTTPAGLKADFQEDKQVAVAGRLLAIRDMGKSQFFVIGDVRGKIQGFLHKNEVDETTWKLWKLLDRGDWVGIRGTTFLTRTGEPTVKVSGLTILSKSLRPLPDKWHGLADKEVTYRKRLPVRDALPHDCGNPPLSPGTRLSGSGNPHASGCGRWGRRQAV